MKRLLVAIGIVLGLVITLALVGFFGLGFYLSPQSVLAKSDVIVAISGGDTIARTAEAVKLYNEGWAPHIIFSGAALDPSSPSNAQTMAKAAEKQGVPSSAIQLEESAANTQENSADVAVMVKNHGYHKLILVTSPYHQRRASILFERAVAKDVTVLNHSSYDKTWRRSDWWATPYSRALTLSELQKTLFELANKPS